MILIYMMVLCTQVNKMYVIATLSVYPHRASLKNMPGHGGIRTYDLWNASPCSCMFLYSVHDAYMNQTNANSYIQFASLVVTTFLIKKLT